MSNKYPHYRYCSVSWCKNSGRINKPGLHFFRIPVDSRLAAWVAYTGRQDLKTKSANLLKNYRVCSDHFTDRDFMNNVIRDRLTRQAVPSVPPDTKVAVSGPKEARSRSASVVNKWLYTCQRTAKRRWKWQSEVGDSSGESLPEQNIPSSASSEASPLPKATHSGGESIPEESVPSPASSEVLPLPKVVECYTLQQSNERDHYTYINVVDKLGEYCMHPNSSLATWDKYTERLERYCKSIQHLRRRSVACCITWMLWKSDESAHQAIGPA
ncbi:hypothetical protein MRX96_010761 [Rhipicephalus microplus]